MTTEPIRLKDSLDSDELARALIGAGKPTAVLPPATRQRIERRVTLLAAAPAAALGVGLWAKVVAAAFGAGFASALTLVSASHAFRQESENGPSSKTLRERAPSHTATITPAPSASAAASAAATDVAPPRSEPPKPAATPSRFASQIRPAPEPESAPMPAGADFGEATNTSLGALPSAEPESHVSLSDLGAGGAPAAPVASASAPAGMSAELQLLHGARLLVSSDPDQALVLLNRHARLFPAAALALEREVLVIEALQHSGRAKEAADRARALLATSPSALYAARLERVLQGH
jgi:hypothetical protein